MSTLADLRVDFIGDEEYRQAWQTLYEQGRNFKHQPCLQCFELLLKNHIFSRIGIIPFDTNKPRVLMQGLLFSFLLG
ncbi:MAG: hypothetical protein V5788_09980 [Shewanella sp.]